MTESNERVTLAVLGNKIDHIGSKLDEALEWSRKDHDVLLRHEGMIAANCTILERHEKQIEQVDSSRKTEGRIIAVITGLLAGFGIIWPKS